MSIATELEQQALDAVEEHGSQSKAAAALGVTPKCVERRISRYKKRKALAEQRIPVLDNFDAHSISSDGQGNVTSVKYRRIYEVEDPILETQEISGISQLVNGEGNELLRWNKYREKKLSEVDLEAVIRGHLENYHFHNHEVSLLVPDPPKERMNLFGFGDPHVGLLAHAKETGANFDLKIACNDLKTGMDLMVQKTGSADTALVLDIGDYFHAQDDKHLTPGAGNKLDVDGRKAKILEEGVGALRYMVEMALMTHRKVVLVMVPGNHDPDLAVVVRMLLQAAFEGNDRVEIMDNSNPFMVYEFGGNLFLFHHGNKPRGVYKPEELFEILAHDHRDKVGRAKNIYIITGHVHHQNIIEHRNFIWISLSTLCASDFWHHSAGYRSQRACQSMFFTKDFGLDGMKRVTKGEIELTRQSKTG